MKRPQITRQEVEAILDHRKNPDPVAIIGIRGYYLDSMGEKSENDRGIYDDAIVVAWRVKGEFKIEAFSANTDPSVKRPGIAVLRTGTWHYKVGVHGLSKPASRRYTALVQAEKVTVDRDGGKSETDWLGINIHRGGYMTTSSLGCQTIWPDQWPNFIRIIQERMKAAGMDTVRYELMNEADRRKAKLTTEKKGK